MGLFDKVKKFKEEKVNNECSFCSSPEMVSIMKTLEKELTSCSLKERENFAVEIWDEPFAFVQSVEFQIKTAGNEIAYLGCYEACRTGKMEYMFNAIYQENRMRFAYDATLTSGFDHGRYWINTVMAFACNDHELVGKMMPHKLGYSQNNYCSPIVNLLMAICYQDNILAERALSEAEKFLSKKHKVFDMVVVEYLQALWKKETDKLCPLLQKIATLERKTTSMLEECTNFRNNELEKTISIFTHGLYALAQYYLEPERFQVVDIPKNENFLKEYEEYRQKKGDTGRPLIIFRNANAEYLNEVIDLLPDVTLIEEKGKNYENADRFAEELFQALYQKGLLRKFYYTRDIAWVAKWGVAEEFERRYREGDEKKLYYKKGLLYYALANPNLKARYQIADFLLAKGAGTEPIEAEFDGPFHYLLRQREHDIPCTVSLCNKLLQSGANPNQAGKENILPIECMLEMKYTEDELLPLYDFWLKIPNLNLNLHTFDGKLPIDIAKIYGRKEFLRRLKSLEKPKTESKTVYEDMLEQMNAYNWDSGFSLPTKVLKNEECDLALAMKIFYLADGYTYLDSLGETKEFPVKWYRFIDKLYKDILEGKYINTDRHFIIPLTKVQKYKLNKKKIEQIFLEDI